MYLLHTGYCMSSRILKQRSDEKPMSSQRRKKITHSRHMEIDAKVFKMECGLLYVHAVRVSAAANKLTSLQKDIRRKQRKVAHGGISKHLDETKHQFLDLLSQCKGDALTIRTILETEVLNPRHPVLARSQSERTRQHRKPAQENTCEKCEEMSQKSFKLQTENQKLDKRCLETKQKLDALEKEIAELRIKLSSLLDAGNHGEETLTSKDEIVSSVSDLYHQEWSDTFRELKSSFEGKEDKDIVAYLLGFIMEIQRTCKDLFSNKVVLTETSFSSNSETVNVMEEDSTKTRKELTESSSLLKIKSYVYTHLKTWLPWPELEDYMNVTATARYINRCMDVCWQMTTHNPPLMFDTSEEEKAMLKPTDYRIYTTEGKFVDFVVWPKVVGENGKVITAGVAEGSDFWPMSGSCASQGN